MTATQLTSGMLIDYVPLDYLCSLAAGADEFASDSPVVARACGWVRDRGYAISEEEMCEFLNAARQPLQSIE